MSIGRGLGPEGEPRRREVSMRDTYKLRGGTWTGQYHGKPIEILVAGHALRIGKPQDLGIVGDRPEDFNVIDQARLRETSGAQGRKKLTEGGALLFGSSMTHGFRFGPEISELHFGIKVKRDEITIKDFNPANGVKGTTVIVSN